MLKHQIVSMCLKTHNKRWLATQRWGLSKRGKAYAHDNNIIFIQGENE